MADSLKRRGGYFFVDNWAGGLNSYFPPNKVGDTQLVEAQNVRFLNNGSLSRRRGLERVTGATTLTVANTDAIGVDLLAIGEGTDHRILVRTVEASKKRIYNHTYDGTDWNPSTTFVTAVNDLESIGTSSFVRESDGTEYFYSALASTGDSGLLVKWEITDYPPNPTTIGDTNTDPPRDARFIVNTFGRLWAAGFDGEKRNEIYFSEAGFPEIFNRTFNAIVVDSQQGQAITALVPFKDNLLFVGLEGSTWLIALGGAPQLDATPVIVSNDIGVGAHKTCVSVGEDLLYMDSEGAIRSLNQSLQARGAQKSVPLSLPIQDYTDDRDKTALHLSSAGFFDNTYWVNFKTVTSGWVTFSYNLYLQKWAGPHVFKDPSDAYTLQLADMARGYGDAGGVTWDTRNNHFYFLTDDTQDTVNSIEVYEQGEDSQTTDGSAGVIDMVAVTKAFDYGTPEVVKMGRVGIVQYVEKDTGPGSFTIEGRTDFGTWHMLTTVDFISDDPDPVVNHRFSLRALPRGELLQFRIKCSTTGDHPEIIRLGIDVSGVSNTDIDE